MARHFARGMVVLADGSPTSADALRVSLEYSQRTIALAPEGVDVPGASEVVHPRRGGLSIDALFSTAAQARVPWVAMRRDIASPTDALGQLLESTGRHASAQLPGFAAVLTADRGDRPIERILVVLDRVDGQPSGLMVLIAVAAAEATGARLDVLLLGAPGETLTTPRTADDVLRITRDVDLAEQARRLSDGSGIRATWIVVEDVADRTALVLEQVAEGDYDLLIDDLGAVRLGGRMRRGRRVRAALGPGGPGGIARAVLEQTDVPVAIVLDAVRLGVVPPAVVKGGAGAVLALGILASASPAATASPSDRAKIRESVSQSVDAYETALGEAAALTAPVEVQEATQTAQASAAESKRVAHEAMGTPTETPVTPDLQPAAQATAGTDQDAGSTGEAAGSDDAAGADASIATADMATDAPAAVSPAELAPEEVSPDRAPTIDPDSVDVDSDVDGGDVAKAQKAADKADQELKKSRKAFDAEQQDAVDALDDAKQAAEQAGAAADTLAAAEQSYEQVYTQTEATLEAADGLAGALRSGSQEQIEAAEQAQSMALVAVDEARIQADAALAEYQQAATEAATAYEEMISASADVTAADAAAQEAHATAEATEAAYEEALAQARVTPVPGYAITTGHGASGAMWSTGTHTGVDYAAPSGTEVVAAASGTVVEVSSGGAYGNRIVIEHEDGYRTSYSHLSGVDVSVGQEVTAGDHIGAVGSTGNSSGPHLHFEVTQGGDGWSGGGFVDPAAWLAQG
jgi:murein DD-endopeptidase MepM/ murein hydrolase activator NlpD